MPTAASGTAGNVLGIFAGGRGRRMGGRAKSDLHAPGSQERLVDRLARIAGEAQLACVVVGSHPESAPLRAGLAHVADEPAGIGPLGGLAALLRFARTRPAIVIACDMPFVTAALVERLARDPRDAAILAPRETDAHKWQPLFARYDAPRVLPVLERAVGEGVRSFQDLFARLDVVEFELEDAERALLRDWDTPEDIG